MSIVLGLYGFLKGLCIGDWIGLFNLIVDVVALYVALHPPQKNSTREVSIELSLVDEDDDVNS